LTGRTIRFFSSLSWASEGFFFRAEGNRGFFRELTLEKFHFSNSKAKRKKFFIEKLMAKCTISKSRVQVSALPLSDAHVHVNHIGSYDFRENEKGAWNKQDLMKTA